MFSPRQLHRRGHSPFWYLHRISLFWARYRVWIREAIGRPTDLLWIVLLLGLYGVMGKLDYDDALINQAEEQAQEAERQSDITNTRLLACLNGKATGLYTTDEDGNQTHIICDPAWELKVGKP